MECACIRGTGSKFDFYLDLLDCDTVVFTDLSNWMTEDYYNIPDEHPMTITFPDGTKKDVMFKPQGSTIFRSSDLQIGCFLDGVYCFSTYSCGYTYSRNEALLCSLECKLDTLISQLDISTVYGKASLEKAKTLSTYLESVKTNARLSKIDRATKLFHIVSKELEGVDCL